MTYSKILNECKKKKILVIGDLILDRYIWGRVNRISPEAPVPVVEVSMKTFSSGALQMLHTISYRLEDMSRLWVSRAMTGAAIL